MTRVRAVGMLVALQVALGGVYLVVERSRTASAPFAVERLDEPVPALRVERDGERIRVPAEPHLVHFWATWCVPCVTELPQLLVAAEDAGVPLVAVTDERWPDVERFFAGQVPEAVVRDAGNGAAAAWRVSGLPDTFVVREGRIVGRMGGPRAWNSEEAAAFMRTIGRSR